MRLFLVITLLFITWSLFAFSGWHATDNHDGTAGLEFRIISGTNVEVQAVREPAISLAPATIIPSKVTIETVEYTVTRIATGTNATTGGFRSITTLTSIVIPETVTHINNNAFGALQTWRQLHSQAKAV